MASLHPYSSFSGPTGRELYRQFLRELTYFPDQTARPALTGLIRRGFELSRQKIELASASASTSASTLPSTSSSTLTPSSTSPSRKNGLGRLKFGHAQLRRLQDANAGDARALVTCLCFAYGRQGPRRHQLINSVLPVSETKSSILDRITTRAGSGCVLTPGLAVTALANSQFSTKPPINGVGLSVKPVKHLRLELGEANIFQRPMTESKMRRKSLEWVNKQVLDRILPPLPDDEWTKLRDLATGRRAWPGPISRRKPARRVGGDGQDGKSPLETALDGLPAEMPFSCRPGHLRRLAGLSSDISILTSAASSSAISALFESSVFATFESRPNRNRSRWRNDDNDRVLNERTVRRAWAKVFAVCPAVRPSESEWTVEWGSSVLADRRTSGERVLATMPASIERSIRPTNSTRSVVSLDQPHPSPLSFWAVSSGSTADCQADTVLFCPTGDSQSVVAVKSSTFSAPKGRSAGLSDGETDYVDLVLGSTSQSGFVPAGQSWWILPARSTRRAGKTQLQLADWERQLIVKQPVESE